jgi:hypothetical protein
MDRLVDLVFQVLTLRVKDFVRRDRILAGQAPILLLSQLMAWLVAFFVGFSLILWPAVTGGITTAFSTTGDALWAFGNAPENGAAQRVIVDLTALTGLVVVALQISYLPALYAAFNRRATEVALLHARAGVPAWGPDLLARTHYGLGTGSTLHTLPVLYNDWERWSADIMETHTTYPPLVRIRAPLPYVSWVTALLAVLDSAALMLSLSPSEAPTIPARMCLRSGFQTLQEIASTMGFIGSHSGGMVNLTYEEFLAAVKVMRDVNFPIERRPEDAWPDFVGWRINYEQAAYAIARAIDAPPALWSGPRRFKSDPVPPFRPPL